MAKQTINLGTAGQGDGENLRSGGVKINENFTELYADKLDNVIYINEPDDFPDAVGGVRELVPSSGASVTYIVATKEIDMGSDIFTITDGTVEIRGTNRTGSQITTSSNLVMFECEDANFFSEIIGFSCPNAQWVDFSVPSLGTFSFANQNVVIYDCATIGNVDGSLTTSLRTLTVVNASSEGLSFTGTHSQLNISQMLAFNWSNALIDLNNATFEIINIIGGNRFISPSGTTILEGMANNGNLTSGGRGIVENNLFNGVGTALTGINTQDTQWNFEGNIFADNTTPNTRPICDAFMLSTETVTISSSGVYYPISGSNWQTDINSRFTIGIDGLVTYNGLETIGAIVTSSATIEKTGGGSDFLSMQVAVNGVAQNKSKGSTDNTSPTQVVSNGIFILSTGDTIQLYVANEDSTSNIIVEQAKMIIRKEI